MMNNEKKLSRSRKNNLRKNKIDERLLKFKNAIKYAKRKKKFIKVKNVEIELVEIKHANIPSSLQDELKEFNKIFIFE